VPPAGGTLELVATDDARASAEIIGGARDETLVVLPGELRVRNDAASAASYRVTLPRGVRAVRVRVGGSAEQEVVLAPAAGARRVVTLRTGHVAPARP
jgi:hypothetical protein